MVTMRVLTTLLSVLIVANARVINPRNTTVSEVEESTTESPVYVSQSERPEYVSSTDQPEFQSTVEYNTTDNFGNDNYTVPYIPEIIVQCGISQDNVFDLDAYSQSSAIFDVYSNTVENTTYSNNQDCRIQLRSGADPVWVTVLLNQLDLENSTYCSWDYLCIKGAKFCGKSSYSRYLKYAIPSNNTFTFKFHTDSSVMASGFRFNIYTWRKTSDGYSYEPYGIISNPDEILNSRQFNESDYVDYCNNEYNQVYYGTSPSYYQSTPGYYNTESPNSGEEQVIQCNSGSTDNYYYLTNNNYGTTEGYYAFRQNNNNNNRYILRSDNFGNGNYSANINCKVKFFTSSVPQRLTVHYSSFDLENVTNCLWDSLCVNGVKYCSNWLQGLFYYYNIPAYSSFSINFVTDFIITRPGFEVYLTFNDAPASYDSYEPTSGDGSEQANVVYSYTNNYSYQDRCASDYTSAPTSYYDAPSSTDEPRIDFGDSAVLQSYVNVIKSNVDEAATNIGVVKDLIDSLPSVE